jgi:23S rRNA pseudouridine1911/1915/1917 synthase
VNRPESPPLRLDQAIAARHPELSRRKARELIAERRVLVNDRPVAVASKVVRAGDRIVIVESLPELSIVARTEELIAVNKPAGMPVQPVRERDRRSLEELLRLTLKQEGGASELFVVHRIDSTTSGVVVFARTQLAAARLSRLFASGEIDKRYLAIVDGIVSEEITVDAPIGRATESTFAVREDGKPAVTILRPLATGHDCTLVMAEIRTGRTHQIRVHAASIGHAVCGDRKYGSRITTARFLLHAWRLTHPELGDFVAPPAEDMQQFAATYAIPWPEKL